MTANNSTGHDSKSQGYSFSLLEYQSSRTRKIKTPSEELQSVTSFTRETLILLCDFWRKSGVFLAQIWHKL